MELLACVRLLFRGNEVKKNDDWKGMGQENGWKILPFRLKVSQIR